jgi:predicted Rossmann fold flavoprotein
MCAIEAGKRGLSVVLVDHAHKLAEKIRISGGGRCNFTNINTKADFYLSQNPHFCRSALARYTPQHFIALLEKHGLHYSEKTLGQLFCDDGSEAIIQMLKEECDSAGVKLRLSCEVTDIQPLAQAKDEKKFKVSTSCGNLLARSLVIATGGLSIPKIGASSFGYKVAEQFGISMTKLHPGLVSLSFHPEVWAPYAELAGISIDAEVSYGKQAFRESVLFTHRGLSGPAILQISSYWESGQPLHIDLLPDIDLEKVFIEHRSSKMRLDNFLTQFIPKRFAEVWSGQFAENIPLNQHAEKALTELANHLHNWIITPNGTLGYNKAEVTCGGVDTQALSSKTMEATAVPGLYFIGEVVDVTGQLGGYNFQWAWASGYAAGQAV